MKNSPHIKPFVAALAALAITTSFASAQTIQTARDNVITTGKVSLTKGAYTNVTLGNAANATGQVTETVSATLASANISATAIVAVTDTTVTGTLTTKLATAKIGNKELLYLITGASNSTGIRNLSLAYVIKNTGLLGDVEAGTADSFIVGALRKGTNAPIAGTVQVRGFANPTFAAGRNVDYTLWQSIKPNTKTKPFAGGFEESGYGIVDVDVKGPVSGFMKTNSIAGVSNLMTTIKTTGTFKQLRANGTDGVITNSANGSYTTKATFGGELNPLP